MSHYIEKVTVSLENLISELARNPSLFLKNPDTDFSRNRKINFKTCVGITMNSGGCTLNKELLDFFDFDVNAPTVSAYTQQRAKILPEAFEYLFHAFTEENAQTKNLYEGYQLLACDGSNLTIAPNLNDPETLWKSNQLGATGNHLHLNALYDVLNRTYIDALVQTASTYQEHRACIQMIERVTLDKVILIADRGYENYNIMSHAIEKGWKFLIRIKDVHSNGIASGLELPQTAVFDMDINLILTRNQTKSKKQAGYKFMPTVQTFDYLPIGSKEDYPISFRIARFKIADDSYETVITNLDRFCFSAEKLKELYHLRWGIETSFRELKYAIAKRLMAILPFKEVKSALTEWLDANIDDKSDLNLIKHYLSDPEALAKVAKAMAKNEAQMEAKKNKIKSAKELIEQGDRKQRESGKDDMELEISPISEKGKLKREQNLDRQLADSMDNFISVARGLSFSSRPSNKEERIFLEQEYDGHCQICLKQIRKYNGEHYFEAINIIKFSKLPERLANSGKYGWNSLCLCPNCAAEYNYCSKKISSLYDQVMQMEVEPGSEETLDIGIEMPEGKARRIRYSPRHFMALKEAFKIFADEK